MYRVRCSRPYKTYQGSVIIDDRDSNDSVLQVSSVASGVFLGDWNHNFLGDWNHNFRMHHPCGKGAPVAQWVKRWPTDLVARSSSPA